MESGRAKQRLVDLLRIIHYGFTSHSYARLYVMILSWGTSAAEAADPVAS